MQYESFKLLMVLKDWLKCQLGGIVYVKKHQQWIESLLFVWSETECYLAGVATEGWQHARTHQYNVEVSNFNDGLLG